MTLLHRGLAPEPSARLAALVLALKRCKGELQGIVDRVDGASRCAGCGGACCAAGRYHVTGVDLLVYLVERKALFAPRFDHGLCPYLGEAGCLIPAAYRPFNCITFNCELIEDLLDPQALERFYRLERELRGLYREIDALAPGQRLGGALLDLELPHPVGAPKQRTGGSL